MNDFTEAVQLAWSLIREFDPVLLEIILLSLRVSLSAVFFAALIGLPLAALLAGPRFPGQSWLIHSINSLMGFPPVVMGLIVYLLLSRSGPLGVFGLLYTPTAMIIAQTLLVAPLIAAVARQSLRDLYLVYHEQAQILALSRWQRVILLLRDGRPALMTAILAGFGRAIAEVGAVMIVGGNINHHTRVMTTSIALETSKGNLSLALALGIVLLLLALLVNALSSRIRSLR